MHCPGTRADAHEVLAGIRALQREKAKARQLTYLAAALVTFSLLLLLLLGGMVLPLSRRFP